MSHANDTLLVGNRHCMSAAGPGRAHFLFVRILPAAEAGRFAEVYFSDSADAGDPLCEQDRPHQALGANQNPGQFAPLEIQKTPDRLRAVLPARGASPSLVN